MQVMNTAIFCYARYEQATVTVLYTTYPTVSTIVTYIITVYSQ